MLRVYGKVNQATTIQFIDYVLAKLPSRSTRFRPTNGAEFESRFHWHVVDQGIEHVYIRPKTPRLNGRVERSHRIDQEEFYWLLEGEIIDDAKIFNGKLAEWEVCYNFDRPHGALGGQTPYERLRQKTTAPS